VYDAWGGPVFPMEAKKEDDDEQEEKSDDDASEKPQS